MKPSGASMADRLAGLHPQMLRAESAGSESDRKKLADHRALVGQLVARALELAGITKQDAAYRMGYRDPGVVSRWCSAVERPLLDKLFVIDGFVEALVLAIAEQNPQIESETIVRIRRRA